MSIKLMAQVWERKLNKAEQSVLLAMADHAQDDGSKCFPSVDWIAWKTDYSPRQVQRTIKALSERGVLVLVRGYGRGRSNEYFIVLSKTEPKPEYVAKGDAMSLHKTKDDTMSPNKQKGDTTSPQSVKHDIVSPQTDATSQLKGDISSVKGDIYDIKGDIAMSPEPLEPPIQPEEDEDDTPVRARERAPGDPIHVAWFEHYGEAITEKLETRISGLVAECGEAAVIFGIKASVEAKARNFAYIAKCARNYIPAAASNGTASGYHVELPGVYAMTPPAQAQSPPPASPPTDPWAICLAELEPSLPGVAVSYLKGSTLFDIGDVDGVPVYRVVVEERAALGLTWLIAQAGPAIRRRLGSILGKPVRVEIVAAEQEPT